MLERLELLIGDKTQDITEKTVLVIGLGGVGGYAVETIVRSGIGHIILVDFDKIETSNFNRQLIATAKTVGKYKVDAFEDRIKEINSNCQITKIKERITPDNINLLFQYDVDYIIDACDTIITKASIIEECLNREIKFISCMGMGNKIDPTMLTITDLKKTETDPIAKKLRKIIRDKHISGNIPVVYSKEPKYTVTNGTIPSNSFVPATAGIICTSYVINDILKQVNNGK